MQGNIDLFNIFCYTSDYFNNTFFWFNSWWSFYVENYRSNFSVWTSGFKRYIDCSISLLNQCWKRKRCLHFYRNTSLDYILLFKVNLYISPWSQDRLTNDNFTWLVGLRNFVSTAHLRICNSSNHKYNQSCTALSLILITSFSFLASTAKYFIRWHLYSFMD